MTILVTDLEQLRSLVGVDLGPSEAVLIDQERIDRFADATGDHQWIHVDVERAATGPFGATIAHGYLTLSLIPHLQGQLYSLRLGGARLNYGLGKVRFPSPVRSGEQVRATARITQLDHVAQGVRVTAEITVTAEGAERPACVAETLVLVTGVDETDSKENA